MLVLLRISAFYLSFMIFSRCNSSKNVEELHFCSSDLFEYKRYANFHNFSTMLPFTAVSCDIQDRILHFETAHVPIPALARQIFFDFLLLFFRDFHVGNIVAIQKKPIV